MDEYLNINVIICDVMAFPSGLSNRLLAAGINGGESPE